MPPIPSSAGPWVAGVDGCHAGWVIVLRDRHQGTLAARVVADFKAVLTLPEAPEVVAVDIPIGLLGAARPGGRTCEVLARRLLGKRASSVFSAPTRGALAAYRAGGGYLTVSNANRGGVASAPGLSKQAFAILPKIDEVDSRVAAADQAIVREVHPELCFAAASGGSPMTHSKKRTAGRSERSALLTGLGFASPLGLLGAPMPVGVKPDDLLDACIACWTAERIAVGTAVVLPNAPPSDTRGLRMELWQ